MSFVRFFWLQVTVYISEMREFMALNFPFAAMFVYIPFI